MAQIGYIYLGISLGTTGGLIVALFQMLSHGFAKSLLFLCAGAMRRASGEKTDTDDMKGVGFKAPLAGVAFTIGAFSMVGIPLTGGFVTKLLLMRESMNQPTGIMIAVWALMLISTLLNILYFMRAATLIWKNEPGTKPQKGPGAGFAFALAAIGLSACVIACFLFAGPLMDILERGLALFA